MGKTQINFITILKIAFGFLFGLMVFPSNIKSIVIILTGVLVLVNFIKNKKSFDKKYFLSNSLFFLVLVGTIFFSSNIDEASLKIQTMLSLLAFPLIFSLLNDSDKQGLIKLKKHYLLIYIIGVLLYNIIPFLWFYSGIPNYSFLGMSYHFKNFIMNNIGKYGIHPIYMSMHCGIALIFSLRLFLFVKKKYEKLVLLFLNLMLFFFLLIYARKGPIIAFIITLVIVSFLDYRKYLKYNLLFIFGLTVTFFLIPTTRDRFLELTKIQKTTIDVTSSSNTRFEIYKNSFSLIKKSPFLGYGIGDYQEELDKVYQNNAPVLLNGVYNSHNQYLGFLLIGGVLLLFTFLFYLSHKFNLAFKTNNTLLLSILVFYSIMMLFENILERENGVIFFSFLINFFSLKNLIRNE